MKSLNHIIADNAAAAKPSLQDERLLDTAKKFEELRSAWNRYNAATGYLVGVENSDSVGMAEKISAARAAAWQRRAELDEALRGAFLNDFTRNPARVGEKV